MNGQIFISYRRDDSLGSTGRIYDRLLEHFPSEQIFMDVDTIPPGEDFIEMIEKAVSNCDVLLAVIGRDWLHIKDRNGRRLLDNDSDFVRAEIRAALQRNVKVIPVLVEDAEVPNPEDLPDDLKLLARRNAIELRHTGFHADVDRLIKAVQRVIQEEDEKARIKAEQKKARKEQLHAQEKETQAWNSAAQENSIAAYTGYLEAYAGSKYAPEAKKRLEVLQKETADRKRQQDFDNLFGQGKAAFEQQQFDAAIRSFNEALALAPGNSACREWLRKCRAAADQKHQEEEQKREAELKQKEADARRRKEEAERQRLEQERLVEEERIERQLRSLEQQGDKLRKKKDYKGALACFEKVLVIQPHRNYSLTAAQQCKDHLHKIAEAEKQKAADAELRKENGFPPEGTKKYGLKHWVVAGVAILVIGVVSFLVFSNKKSSTTGSRLLVADETTKLADERKNGNAAADGSQTAESNFLQVLLQQMVPVSGGSFTMGTDETDFERPAHTVVVEPFFLSKYEVTRQQWNQVMDTARYETNLEVPATGVSWNDVQQFISKLAAASGKPFRLPTEAEWEYACLQGYSDQQEQKLNDYSWNSTNSNDSLHPVGQRMPSALGLYDMLGNAYEWCSDSKARYQSNRKDDERKIIRGGDYKSKPEFISPKIRNWNTKTKPTERIGFRLAMSNEK